MRLGSVIYVIPFVFVLDPSFILHGPWHATLQAVVEAVIGVWLMAGAVQSFLPGIGHLNQIPGRVAIGFGGLAIALPDLALAWAAGPENWVHLIGGVLLVIVGLLLNWSTLKQAAAS